MEQAAATYLGDSYRFVWTDPDIDVIVDRLREERGDLICEMAVRAAVPPYNGLLRQAKFNLSSATTRTAWIKDLTGRQAEVDWFAVIEQVCTLSLRRWREGEPVVDLSEVAPRDRETYLISPYVVEGSVASGIFADGGTGKSLFALALALSVATAEPVLGVYPERMGPVLFLDWEWDAEAHAERLHAICRGVGIEVPIGVIFYRHETASVLEAAPTIRRLISELGIVLVIVDSLGFARGGEPESAELTIKTFAAFRTFGIPVFYVDHVAKQAADKSHSFGSVYTRNSSRMMWRLDAGESSRGKTNLGLVNTKYNVKQNKTRGLLLTITENGAGRLDAITFEDAEPPLLSLGRAGIREAAIAILKANPEGLSIKDMRLILEAEGLKVHEGALGAMLGRKSNRETFQYAAGIWRLFNGSFSTRVTWEEVAERMESQ